MLTRHPGATIIGDVKCSEVLFDGIAAAGGKPLMWKTGHSVIKAKMKELGAPFAGEMAAHFVFADGFYGYDDGLYAAVRVLSILQSGEETLAEFRDSLPQLVNTPELRVPCLQHRGRADPALRGAGPGQPRPAHRAARRAAQSQRAYAAGLRCLKNPGRV